MGIVRSTKLRSTRHTKPCSSSAAMNVYEFNSAAQLSQWPITPVGLGFFHVPLQGRLLTTELSRTQQESPVVGNGAAVDTDGISELSRSVLIPQDPSDL